MVSRTRNHIRCAHFHRPDRTRHSIHGLAQRRYDRLFEITEGIGTQFDNYDVILANLNNFNSNNNKLVKIVVQYYARQFGKLLSFL